MSPSLFGPSANVRCDRCGIAYRINWQPEMRPTGDVLRCWNCGADFVYQPTGLNSGDVIHVDRRGFELAGPEVCDIVAIAGPDRVRIKRIVACPGQTISQPAAELLCDGKRIANHGVWMLVHDDGHRRGADSCWTATTQHGWTKREAGFDAEADAENSSRSSMLRYGHRAAYNRLKPDRVRDDYAANANESRRLREVDRLGLRVICCVERPATMQFWHWRSSGTQVVTRQLSIGQHQLCIDWQAAQSIDSSSIDAEHPLAITIDHGALSLGAIQVVRPLFYWLDTRHPQAVKLPLVLGGDEYFVVGDNVPLSLDSRHHGPVNRRDLLGKVIDT